MEPGTKIPLDSQASVAIECENNGARDPGDGGGGGGDSGERHLGNDEDESHGGGGSGDGDGGGGGGDDGGDSGGEFPGGAHDVWICSFCGRSNLAENRSCSNCGCMGGWARDLAGMNA